MEEMIRPLIVAANVGLMIYALFLFLKGFNGEISGKEMYAKLIHIGFAFMAFDVMLGKAFAFMVDGIMTVYWFHSMRKNKDDYIDD